MKKRIAILGSTNGTSMIPVIDAIQNQVLKDVEIGFVLSNRKNAGILEKARKYGIADIFLSSRQKTRPEYDQEISRLLSENEIKLVLLIGYMKILSPGFVDEWGDKTMNVHPSLLPAFAGMVDLDVHRAVLGRGCKISGATLMFIDHGADTGEIIAQEAVRVFPDDTPETLKTRVQAVEGELLIRGIFSFFETQINQKDRRVD